MHSERNNLTISTIITAPKFTLLLSCGMIMQRRIGTLVMALIFGSKVEINNFVGAVGFEHTN